MVWLARVQNEHVHERCSSVVVMHDHYAMGDVAQIATRRGRVLVVDDEILVRRTITRVLSSEHDIVEARDGAEALDLLRTDPRGFDLVLCDLEMPRMTGAQMCAELANVLPEVLDRVVIVTGGARSPEQSRFLAQREPLVLRKPFAIDELRGLAAHRVRDRSS